MTKFIAEVCINHNRNLKRCISFIDTAANINLLFNKISAIQN